LPEADSIGGVMKQKSTGLRILLGIASIAIGVGVQVVGELVSKFTGIPSLLFILLGFLVMGYLIYKWAIK
jgi:hypothetical protein